MRKSEIGTVRTVAIASKRAAGGKLLFGLRENSVARIEVDGAKLFKLRHVHLPFGRNTDHE